MDRAEEEKLEMAEVKNVLECKSCGSRRIVPKYNMDEWKVWICNDCGFVFVNPLKGKLFDSAVNDLSIAETHHAYREELLLSSRARVDKLVEFFGDLNGLNVLDVGCGNGYFLKYCRERGMKVQGIEINEAAARYAWAKFQIPVAVSPPSMIGF